MSFSSIARHLPTVLPLRSREHFQVAKLLPPQLPRIGRLVRLTTNPLEFLRAQYGRGGLYRVQVRELGAAVIFRGGTTDARVLWDTMFRRYHLPDSAPESILDLGANIGTTAAHFAALYPEARIVAVEMDADSAALARVNTPLWRDRVTVINAAAWPKSGTLRYTLQAGNEYGARILSVGAQDVDAIDIAELTGEGFDYVKMDVDGAKGGLLDAAGWVENVRESKVEVHPPCTTGVCAARLEELGFRATVTADGHHVAAIRPLSWARAEKPEMPPRVAAEHGRGA